MNNQSVKREWKKQNVGEAGSKIQPGKNPNCVILNVFTKKIRSGYSLEKCNKVA